MERACLTAVLRTVLVTYSMIENVTV